MVVVVVGTAEEEENQFYGFCQEWFVLKLYSLL